MGAGGSPVYMTRGVEFGQLAHNTIDHSHVCRHVATNNTTRGDIIQALISDYDEQRERRDSGTRKEPVASDGATTGGDGTNRDTYNRGGGTDNHTQKVAGTEGQTTSKNKGLRQCGTDMSQRYTALSLGQL